MKFSSLAALKVVKMTTFRAASDENFIQIIIFPFQCNEKHPNAYFVAMLFIALIEPDMTKFPDKYMHHQGTMS